MEEVAARNREIVPGPGKVQTGLGKRLMKNKLLYLMILPGALFFIIFKYAPMFGLSLAFQDYSPYQGFAGSPWVGFKHFERLFADPVFWTIFRNTLILFFLNTVVYFPVPIILALMMNEVGKLVFKRFVQTMIYIPHFMSWVIIVSISFVMLTQDGGVVNEFLTKIGHDKVNFLLSDVWFRPTYILQVIWREAGWGTILYLAAITAIDPQLYEAARMDGAGRFRQMWHITLPSIRGVIVVLLILRIGHMMDLDFEHVYLMLNSMNRNVAEIFDTYVYTTGLKQGQFSYSTAVGAFKSIVGLVMVIIANWIAKKLGEEGIY